MNVYRLPQASRIEEPDPLPRVRVPRRPDVAPPRFGIGSAFRVFRLRFWTILTVVLICTAAAGIVLTQLTPLYTASALVVVGQQTGKGAVVDPLATDPAVETQLRVLQSTWLAERAIAALNLARDPEFTRDLPSPVDRLNPMSWFAAKPKIRTGGAVQNSSTIDPAVLNHFASRLTVAAEGRSSIARITFTSNNPVKAALIANTIVAAYLQTQTNVATPAPAAGADEELVRLTQRVREAEAAIESHKTQAVSVPAKDGNALAAEQLTELNAQISVARRSLAEHEGKHRRAVNLMTSGGDPATINAITSSPVIVKLRDKQKDLTRRETELSEKYGDRHPQMIAIREERSALQAKIDDELKRIIKSLASAVTSAKARVTSLETSLGEMQGAATPPTTMTNEAGDPGALRELENELATRRAALEQYRSTAQAPAAIPAEGSRVAAKATAPSEPSFPDTPMIMGGTVFGSTLIGMLFALVMESMGKGFRAGHEIERMAHVSNLAVVPDLKGVKHIADLIMQKPSSSFTEAVRTLYSGLQLSNGDRPPKVVVVTSSIPHEGKTSLAVSLGRLASKGGARVILIDADLRHPSVGAAFSPRRPEAGLVEVLTGQRKLRDVLHRDPISPLEFIPTAAPAQSPSELLASPAMKNMMDILRQHYDLVIVDAAPVLPVSDTRLLSRIADKMVYVVGWNTTPREAVVAGLRLLHDANVDVAGTVLNQADMRRHAIYSYDSASYGYGTKYARYHTQ